VAPLVASSFYTADINLTLFHLNQAPKKFKAKKGREKHQLDNDLQQIDTVSAWARERKRRVAEWLTISSRIQIQPLFFTH